MCKKQKFKFADGDNLPDGMFKHFTVLQDGRLALLGTNDVVYLFTTSPEVSLEHFFFDKYGYQAKFVAASPGRESLLAVAGASGLAIYHCEDYRKVFKFSGSILDVQWSPSSRYLAFIVDQGGKKQVAYCVDLHNEREAKKLRFGDDACLLSFSPFENWLIIGVIPDKHGITNFRVIDIHSQTQTQFEIINES
jgi:hypothetical protein